MKTEVATPVEPPVAEQNAEQGSESKPNTETDAKYTPRFQDADLKAQFDQAKMDSDVADRFIDIICDENIGMDQFFDRIFTFRQLGQR